MSDMRTLVVSDLHFPYHCPWAVDLSIKIVTVVQPEQVIVDGDLIDFYQLSFFDRDPARLAECALQDEIDMGVAYLRRLRQASPAGTKIVFVPGNHEDRLRRYLWRKGPELSSLRALSLPSLLCLDELGIEYQPDEVSLANDNLVVKHGSVVRPVAGQSAMGELAREFYARSTVTGHTHRLGQGYVRHVKGAVMGMEVGCLCNLRPSSDYIRNANWQNGMGDIEVDGDTFHAATIPFLGEGAGMKALVDGKKIRL